MSIARSLVRSVARPLASAITGVSGGGGGGGSLPLDTVTTAVLAFSVARKLRTAYAGSAIRVRRSSDNAEQDIGFDGSGNLDESALTAFTGANDGFVVKVYEQSGHASAVDFGNATAATQPQIVAAGVVTKHAGIPAAKSNGTTQLLEVQASWATRPASAYPVIAMADTRASGFAIPIGTDNGAVYGVFGQSGSATTLATAGAGSPLLYVNGALAATPGVDTRGDAWTAMVTSAWILMRQSVFSFSSAAWDGLRTCYQNGAGTPEYMSELTIITDAAELSALESNMASFYGVTL